MKTIRVEFRTKYEGSWIYFTEFWEVVSNSITRYAVIEKLKNDYGLDTQLINLKREF